MAIPPHIIEAVTTRLGEKVQLVASGQHPRLEVHAADWLDLATFLRHEPSIELDWLRCLTGIDYAADQKMAVAFELWSFRHRHDLALKVWLSRPEPQLPTVSHLWKTANWHEREAYDLMGITFTGHPDLRRILLADDWEGHPLRKDYVFPREYHGIPGSVELDWQQS